MYPDMEHPVLVHDASEMKITLHYITLHYDHILSISLQGTQTMECIFVGE